MKRSIGYCLSLECESQGKSIFLLNQKREFSCPQCRRKGMTVHEKGYVLSLSNHFREVRVKFDYQTATHNYLRTVVVRDDNCPTHFNTYVVESPMIMTEKRGLAVAEFLLGTLSLRQPQASLLLDNLQQIEFQLDLSDDQWYEKVVDLGKLWGQSTLTQGENCI